MRVEAFVIRNGCYAYNIRSGPRRLDAYLSENYPKLKDEDALKVYQLIEQDFFDMVEKIAQIIFDCDSTPNRSLVRADGRSGGWLVVADWLTALPNKNDPDLRIVTLFNIVEDMMNPLWWKETLEDYISVWEDED